MRFLKSLAIVAALFSAISPAAAGNTTLYSSTNGDVVFPLSPPTNAGTTPGALDNTAIGATTPAAGTFTTVSSTGLNTSAGLKFTGTAPVPTGTGTPTIATGSTDTSGEVTAGASATSVVITFAVAKTNAPFCVVRSQSQITSFAYTLSTTAITITQTATSANLIDYICVQH